MRMLLAAAVLLAPLSVLAAEAPAKSDARSAPAHELKLSRAGKVLVNDRFDGAEVEGRRLTRGEWKLEHHEAICTQDDALYAMYKNHGPAVWYDRPMHNVVIRFEYLASPETTRFVFTVNGKDGHLFRFLTQEAGTDVRAWNPDHTPRQVAKDGPKLVAGEWVPVTVELVGERASVQIGRDYAVLVENPGYAAEKVVTGVSFHHGTVRLRNFQVSEALPPAR